ncbi:glycosyltransferase [Pseudomaricurvus alkylphenolicus]|uniref:TIGR04282 family arsenosugar biosynthesis glycosyltransferase n=1 Tax=Pseudomaricurvus alkylphenolicus TaxID=1306991 RepID=UPI001422F511|nr:TIGR04282 family arsenosugar biosynthesis glycosyltransferase [Pseudomaricurvus alkylphenolicus]NIB43266.1 glycosyltransferase [Pseudomaricurvus alkylphenolicus]
MRSSLALLQFVKPPHPGQVKTRMRPHLSEEQCLRLHCAMATHVFEALNQPLLWDYELWLGGPLTDQDQELEQLLGVNAEELGPGFSICQQQGADLGARMHDALQQSLASHDFAIVIGSDCPWLDLSVIERMQSVLERGAEAVVVPARDGGYVALGLSRPLPGLFKGVSWGTEKVLLQTLERLQSGRDLGRPVRYQLLEELADVDRPEDLLLLQPFSWAHPFLDKALGQALTTV